MKRTKLQDRVLPAYTRGEEIFNTVSHIVGGGFGVIALLTCLLYSAFCGDVWSVVSSAIYMEFSQGNKGRIISITEWGHSRGAITVQRLQINECDMPH